MMMNRLSGRPELRCRTSYSARVWPIRTRVVPSAGGLNGSGPTISTDADSKQGLFIAAIEASTSEEVAPVVSDNIINGNGSDRAPVTKAASVPTTELETAVTTLETTKTMIPPVAEMRGEAQHSHYGSSTHSQNGAPLGQTTAPRPDAGRTVVPSMRQPGSSSSGSSKSSRPLLPLVDFQQLAVDLFGDPKIAPDIMTMLQLDPEATAPKISTPLIPRPPGSADPATLPILIYLPGMDGTGLAAYFQFTSLVKDFDLRTLAIPPKDRQTFPELIDCIEGLIRSTVKDVDPSRPLYLMGESFGCLLAAALGKRCSDIVDRLIFVNPATSFPETPWLAVGSLLAGLPEPAYRALPLLIAPLLTNPLRIALRDAKRGDPFPKQLSDILYGLVELLPQVSSLRIALPPATLRWRLQLLSEGCAVVEPLLRGVPQRTLLLGSSGDLLIPSAREVERLEKLLPRSRKIILRGRSHAALLEAGLDLSLLMKNEGFYMRQRSLSTTQTAPAKPGMRPQVSGAGFGRAVPVEKPTRLEIEKASEAGGLNGLKRFVSPVYYSTGMDGRVVRGLGGIPTSRPLLFVGNHQLFATDMPLMIEQFLSERDMLLRGLAHPTPLSGMKPDGSQDENSIGAMLTSFGAVDVGGRNMRDLLAMGEAVLLYPGGVREALKFKGEEYRIFWPTKPEFVRMAARYGATLIPFGGIGADEAVQQVLDGREMLEVPLVGPWVREQAEKASKFQARRGAKATDEVTDLFLPPLLAPKIPGRYYYHFQQPIPLTPEVANDRALCEELYTYVREQVEGSMKLLQQRTEDDPYKEFLPRIMYEASRPGKQAPSFEPRSDPEFCKPLPPRLVVLLGSKASSES